jgi:hypothetical protein
VIWAWKNVCLRFQFEQEGLITANVYWFCEKLLLTTGPLLELPDEIPLPGTITVKNQDLGL